VNAHAQRGAQSSQPPLYGFHLVLLAAHADAAEWMKRLDLPPGAARALRDAGEFLPYKGYVVLDDVRVRAQLSTEARTALQYGEHEYSAVIRADNEPMQVSVRLKQLVPAPNGRRELEVLSATFNAGDIEAAGNGAGRRAPPDASAGSVPWRPLGCWCGPAALALKRVGATRVRVGEGLPLVTGPQSLEQVTTQRASV
jgi:hypothetical protein